MDNVTSCNETTVLLTAINAKYIHSNLAAYSLRAYASEYKDNIHLAEFTINHRTDFILQEIYKRKPDVLCFSCYIWNIEFVQIVATEFHKLRPKVPIWVGGPEVSYETDTFMDKNPWCTGIIVGEGEATFKDLVEYYIQKGIQYGGAEENIDKTPEIPKECDIRHIQGVVCRTENGIMHTSLRPPMNMDDIPFAYENVQDFENRIIYYESSRGCPFSCSYCLSSVDKKLRFRSTDIVKRELQFFIDARVPQVKFVDRTFNCEHNHAMEIWEYIYEHDNGITNFHFEISADLLREEEIEFLNKFRPGLVQLEIGVQSTNDETISEIHRTMNLDRLKTCVRLIQGAGNIHEHLDLIAGLPFESREKFKKSFNEIYELKPNQLQLGFLKVLKGSYMYEHQDEYGVIYQAKAPYEVMSTKWLSYEDVIQIKQVEEMLEVYYNSGQFQITIKLLEVMHSDAYEMFSALGRFYEEKGYFNMNHNRLRRAEILLEYVKECKNEVMLTYKDYDLVDIMQESLTFDLYYRENCKTRPAWAIGLAALKDISEYQDISRRFITKGKLQHLEPLHYTFPGKDERTINELPERTENIQWIMFHYDDRDPLDNQARVERVNI